MLMKNIKGKAAAIAAAVFIAAGFAGCSLFSGEVQEPSPASQAEQTQSSASESSSTAGSKPEQSRAESKSSAPLENSKRESSPQQSSKNEASKNATSKPEGTQQTTTTETQKDTGFVDFGGKSEDYTLRELYESSDYTDLIETAKKQYESDKYTIDYELSGENKIIITARLINQLDSTAIDRETAEPYFEKLKQQAGTYIGLLEGITTTKDIEITAILLNADGTKLMERTFTHQNTQADSTELPPRDLQTIQDSGLLDTMLSEIPSKLGDSGATVSAKAVGNNELAITAALSTVIPEGTGAQAAIEQQLESVSGELERIRGQLAVLTGEEDFRVSVEIIDANGRSIAKL